MIKPQDNGAVRHQHDPQCNQTTPLNCWGFLFPVQSPPPKKTKNNNKKTKKIQMFYSLVALGPEGEKIKERERIEAYSVWSQQTWLSYKFVERKLNYVKFEPTCHDSLTTCPWCTPPYAWSQLALAPAFPRLLTEKYSRSFIYGCFHDMMRYFCHMANKIRSLVYILTPNPCVLFTLGLCVGVIST